MVTVLSAEIVSELVSFSVAAPIFTVVEPLPLVDSEYWPVRLEAWVKFKVPPLIEFLKEFSRHFQTGELSMVCYAPSRFGKTTARTYLAESLNIRRQMVVYTATLNKIIIEP